MRKTFRKISGPALGALGVIGMFFAGQGPVMSADHFDPPTRTDPAADPTPDIAADIADIYAWSTPTSLNLALTFAGPTANTRPAFYDRDVVYQFFVSNDADRTTPEFTIECRFGADGNAYGVQIVGLPGSPAPLVGPVETVLQRDGIKAIAGVFADPFFFDVQGFRETRSTGTLSIRSDRNLFDTQNDTAIILEIPIANVRNGSNPIGVWSATRRFGGNI